MTTRRFLSFPSAGLEDPLRPLEPECRVLQFSEPLDPPTLVRAGELLRDRPEVMLYVYRRAAKDLDFLRHFPGLQRLHVALFDLSDIAGLAHVRSSLTALTFGATRQKFSLAFLPSLAELEKLFLVRHAKDLDAVSGLSNLTDLGLSGITRPNIDFLLPLTGLSKLAILLGGTTNLADLPRLPALQELFLMRITRIADLSVLAELKALRTLRLDWMRNVTRLPSLAPLTHLDAVKLDTMKGLTDLSPIAAAPRLRRLVVAAMPQLTADSFACFHNHPSLAELWANVGKARVNEAIRRRFPTIAR